MANSILVKNLDAGIQWQKQLGRQEAARIISFCEGRAVVELFPALLFPVRTHHPISFAIDLIAPTLFNHVHPTLFNHALKIKDFVIEIFVVLGAIFIDFLTLPIRLLTAIPRVIHNSREETHPLLNYLQREQGVNKEILEAEHVRVELRREEGDIEHYQGRNVNFFEVPAYYKRFDYFINEQIHPAPMVLVDKYMQIVKGIGRIIEKLLEITRKGNPIELKPRPSLLVDLDRIARIFEERIEWVVEKQLPIDPQIPLVNLIILNESLEKSKEGIEQLAKDLNRMGNQAEPILVGLLEAIVNDFAEIFRQVQQQVLGRV